MYAELEMTVKKTSVTYSICPCICLEGLKKTRNLISVYSVTATIQTQYLLECCLSLNIQATMH